MKLYITISIVAYLAFAINAIIDKFLLRRSIPHPAAYAFYIGMLNAVVVILAPFGFALPDVHIILIAAVSGLAFVYALVMFFKSLQFGDASVVLPAIGGMVPIISWAMNFFVLQERLATADFIGLWLLVAGTFLIGIGSAHKPGKPWFARAATAAVLFAISFSTAKIVYDNQEFISGLIWTRLGAVGGALTLLFVSRTRRKIFQTTTSLPSPSRWLFLWGQGLAAGAAILQNYAVKLGSVTVVNALQGTQFVFLFMITAIMSKYYPRILWEDFSAAAIARKVAAIVLISLGLTLVI